MLIPDFFSEKCLSFIRWDGYWAPISSLSSSIHCHSWQQRRVILCEKFWFLTFSMDWAQWRTGGKCRSVTSCWDTCVYWMRWRSSTKGSILPGIGNDFTGGHGVNERCRRNRAGSRSCRKYVHLPKIPVSFPWCFFQSVVLLLKQVGKACGCNERNWWGHGTRFFPIQFFTTRIRLHSLYTLSSLTRCLYSNRNLTIALDWKKHKKNWQTTV